MLVKRIVATESALGLLSELQDKHGALLLHQSGGCCDGSVPMCFTKDEFLIDHNDVLLGLLDSVPFYMSADQFEYWKHTQLTLEISPGRGSGFSLESSTGNKFVIQSRMFTDAELTQLSDLKTEK